MILRRLAPALCVLMLAACSSAPSGGGQKTAETRPAPKPTKAETGRVILQELYTTSRGWAPDTKPVSLESQNYRKSDGSNDALLGHDGKSPLWRAIFASAARRSMKTYMWSGLSGPDAPSSGVTPGNEDPYSSTNTSTQVFDLVYLKTDSDRVLEAANKHGGELLLKKEATLPVNFRLEWEPRGSMLVWHVLYGQSTNEPKLDVVVNATSGQFVRVEK
jgi:hypothetical protein